MRIALISYEFPPETLGGIGTYAQHAVQMLTHRGHDVTVFSSTTAAEREERGFGARVLRLPCADRRNFHAPAVARLASEHLRRSFEVAEVPDLYAEGRGLRTALPELPLVLRAHTPVYIPTEIDFNALSPAGRLLSAARGALGGLLHLRPPGSIWREARRRQSFLYGYDPRADAEYHVAKEADVVAPPSKRLAARLKTDWQLSDEQIQVLPYPHLPSEKLLSLPPPSGRQTIAFHGGVRRFKGIHVLIEAMHFVLKKNPGARLVIAGASGGSSVPACTWSAWKQDRMLEFRDTLEWLRPQLAALGDRVILRGFIRPEHLADHLAEADVCVFPSLFDNFPSACLEAMSAARPIVATRSGGMEEMLGADEAGLLVPPSDPAALGAAICRLLDDASLGRRLALAARAKVTTAYAPDTIGPRHEGLYTLAQSRRATALHAPPMLSRSVDR